MNNTRQSDRRSSADISSTSRVDGFHIRVCIIRIGGDVHRGSRF